MSFSVKEALAKSMQVSREELEYITSHFTPLSIRKKEHLFTAGEICKLAAYCEKGCFRKYIVNDKGDDVVIDFFVEDYWVGDLNSLIKHVPTLYNFQALEDCSLQVMPYSDWERIALEIPGFRQARQVKELKSHDMAVEMLTLEKYAGAEQKYLRLLTRFPGLPNRIAAVHIASYLGIKPESFSRMKKKFAGK